MESPDMAPTGADYARNSADNATKRVEALEGAVALLREQLRSQEFDHRREMSDLRGHIPDLVRVNCDGMAVGIMGRECALRFETDLRRAVAAEMAVQLAPMIKELGLVPLPDISSSVEQVLDTVIGNRLLALIGNKSVTIGVK